MRQAEARVRLLLALLVCLVLAAPVGAAKSTYRTSFTRWRAAGVPVVISYAWKKSTLDGAPIPSSNGHLAVLVGFDAAGNPIVNDPAAAKDDEVQRTYNRVQLETVWLENSGGTVYLIYPPGLAVPPL